MNFAKFLEPPQKNVTASSWLAIKVFTFSYIPNVVLGNEDSRVLVLEATRRLTSFRIA